MKQLTPPAQGLVSAIDKILASAKSKISEKGKSRYVDDALMDKMKAMSAADMLSLEPPSVDAGIWTTDAGFCNRLGAYIFGVSVETVAELPWQYLIFFQQIITANFIQCLEEVTP